MIVYKEEKELTFDDWYSQLSINAYKNEASALKMWNAMCDSTSEHEIEDELDAERLMDAIEEIEQAAEYEESDDEDEETELERIKAETKKALMDGMLQQKKQMEEALKSLEAKIADL